MKKSESVLAHGADLVHRQVRTVILLFLAQAQTMQRLDPAVHHKTTEQRDDHTQRGADQLAVRFAVTHDIKLYKFPANWDGFGKRAGFIRNTQMGDFADALLVFWDGQSNGTKHMIDYMHKLKKPVHIHIYTPIAAQ